jgi:SAM-dependent methyltransferase
MCKSLAQSVLFMSTNGYPIVQCDECHLAFTDDRDAPSPDTLYPAFEQTKSGVQEIVRSALSVFLRQREAFVKSVVPRGRLLDFGCGAGAFARWMAKSGYEVVGIEPFSLGEPLKEEGLTLVRESLESASTHLGTFDVITMWQVLEHLKNPVEVLEQLKKLLRPGGRLIVSVPNFGSMQSTLFRGAWFHLDPPRHLIHFDQKTLRDCMVRAGLTPAEEKRFLPEYGGSGWVQSTLNRILPHKNFLFEAIKDRGALRDMGKLSSALHLAASAALGTPVLMASIPLEAVASARDEAAALTIAAKL